MRMDARCGAVHSKRIPLSPTGTRLMGLVYFTVPILVGYGLYFAVDAWRPEVQVDRAKEQRAADMTRRILLGPPQQGQPSPRANSS